MGIKHLNKYLQTNCSKSIKQISLNDLRNKKIVIDTSIYLYRFLGENALLENFYLMISIFREYNIIPLFVFDGKPPKEKNELLQKRKNDKKEAEKKYKDMEHDFKHRVDDMDEDERKELNDNMELLKKDFIRLRHTDIENVKLLIQSYGVSYIDAPGEADKLCAKMVCKNMAYACLSEDMDLFVYGCSRVLRYLSLLKRTVIIYDMKGMLNDLDLSLDEFRSICIASGTDYNMGHTHENKNIDLLKTLKYFKKYKKSGTLDFYEWLKENTDYIKNMDDLYHIQSLFNLTEMPEYKQYENLKIMNGPINKSNLMLIMEKEDFLFAI
jgi:flap endonuclease-1